MGIVAGLGISSADRPGREAGIRLVKPIELNEQWPRVSQWLLRHHEYWSRFYDLEDLYLMLFCEPERYQLWLVGEWSEAFGCLMTEIRQFPKCKMLVYILAVAEPDGQPKLGGGDFYHEAISLWARDQGVTYSRIEGREAWKRIGKSLGYTEVRVALTKSLEHMWRQ